MENQNTKILINGAEIQVTPAGSVYVTINGMTVYFENGSIGPNITAWSFADMWDKAKDLTPYIYLESEIE
jgi:hypothetical protein